MSAMESPVLEKTNFELKFWKESYHNLNRKYHLLKEEKENDEFSPAKRARIEDEEKSTDPLRKLPEPCTRIIMQYLTAKELLKAMGVSKFWKNFVESRSVLMNRIMDKIVVKPPLPDYSLPLINFDDDKINRAYKHMEGPIQVIRGFKTMNKTIVHPIVYYARTLETLEITEDDDLDITEDSEFYLKKCDFPTLKKLKLTCWDLRILEDFSFPVLTHLAIDGELDHEERRYTLIELKKVLSKLPKLKVLDSALFKTLLRNDNVPSNEPVSIDSWIFNAKQPAIEFISLYNCHPNFLRAQQNSLVKLTVSYLNFRQISWLLRDLKLLKSLTIGLLENEGEENFTANYNIEQLRIFHFDRFAAVDINQDYNNKLQILFLAVPSLIELTLAKHLNEEIFRHLASNMTHLKKLVCMEYDEESLSVYAEIRSNPHQYINSSFEFSADPSCYFHKAWNEFFLMHKFRLIS